MVDDCSTVVASTTKWRCNKRALSCVHQWEWWPVPITYNIAVSVYIYYSLKVLSVHSLYNSLKKQCKVQMQLLYQLCCYDTFQLTICNCYLMYTFLPQHSLFPGKSTIGLKAPCDPSSNSVSDWIVAYSKISGFKLCMLWYASFQCSSVPWYSTAGVLPKPTSMLTAFTVPLYLLHELWTATQHSISLVYLPENVSDHR